MILTIQEAAGADFVLCVIWPEGGPISLYKIVRHEGSVVGGLYEVKDGDDIDVWEAICVTQRLDVSDSYVVGGERKMYRGLSQAKESILNDWVEKNSPDSSEDIRVETI